MATKYGTSGNNTLNGTSSADVLYGRGGDDVLSGVGAADRLYGESGNDTLKGGLGNDLLDGGAGTDRATWYNDGGVRGVIIDLSSNRAIRGGETDTLVSIENATGTVYADSLSGSAISNELRAAGGDDSLSGLGAADRLYGESGNDTLKGGLGNDLLDGGAGTDRATWYNDDGTGGLDVDLSRGTAARGTETDTLISIEDIYGGAWGDTIRGNAGTNHLYGGAGDDELYGGGFGLTGPDGSDLFDGGSGIDTVVFYSVTVGGVRADLEIGQAVRGGETDTLIGIENLYGSVNTDILAGDDGANVIQTFGGADYVDARGGNDRIYASGDNCVVSAGAGSDYIGSMEATVFMGIDSDIDTAAYTIWHQNNAYSYCGKNALANFDPTHDRLSFSLVDLTNPNSWRIADAGDFLDSNDDGFINATDSEVERVGSDLVLDLRAVWQRVFGSTEWMDHYGLGDQQLALRDTSVIATVQVDSPPIYHASDIVVYELGVA